MERHISPAASKQPSVHTDAGPDHVGRAPLSSAEEGPNSEGRDGRNPSQPNSLFHQDGPVDPGAQYARDNHSQEMHFPVPAQHFHSHPQPDASPGQGSHYLPSAVHGHRNGSLHPSSEQHSDLLSLVQQDGNANQENVVNDPQGRQAGLHIQHIHNILPMLLAQNLQPNSQTNHHLPQMPPQGALHHGPGEARQDHLEYRGPNSLPSGVASFQGTGAFAPLRPQALAAPEGGYSAEGELRQEARLASPQGAYPGLHGRSLGWLAEQGPQGTSPSQYSDQGPYDSQVGHDDGHLGHHSSFEHLVEHASSQREGHTPPGVIRPMPHKPPQATKSSRFRGVYKRQRGGRWESSIVLDAKNCRLGLHLTEQAAAKAYDRVAIKKWGPEEAAGKINFPLDHYNLQELETVHMTELVNIVRSEWRSRDANSRPTPLGSYHPFEDSQAALESQVRPLQVEAEPHIAKKQKLDTADNLGLRQSFPTEDSETHERVPIPRSSMYRGVSTHKQSGKWVAQIKSGGKQVYLGFYSDQEDAARAYDQAVIHMQGERAETNFPMEIYAERFDQLRNMDFKDLVAALKQHGRGGVPRIPKAQAEKSAFRGVAPDKSKKWRAQITTSAKTTVYLGLWATEEGAARAYDRANIAKRGEAAKTNYPISDYAHEIASLQAQPYDALVGDLRAEAVASVANDRANKRMMAPGNLLPPLPPPVPDSAERNRQYSGLEHAGPLAGDSARSYSQMDAATLFLNQQHMQQQIQNFGQPANFNANITPNFNVVRNYLMANPTAQRPELFFPRVMNQREADARMELPNVCQAEAWKLA